MSGMGGMGVDTFVKAKTIKDAEKWALENGLADKVNYKKTSVEVANEINRVLSENLKQHNIKLDNIIPLNSRTKENKTNFFIVKTTKNIEATKIRQDFNYSTKNAKDMEAVNETLKKLDSSGLMKNVTLEDALTHESGHVIDGAINVRKWDTLSDDMQVALEKKWMDLDGDIELGGSRYKRSMNEKAGEYWDVQKTEEFAELYRLFKAGKLPKDIEYVADIFGELL